MKIKKFLITLFTSILIIGILCGLNGKSYSATGNLELSIEMLRKSGYGYKAFEKNIWKIVSEDDKYKYDSTIYFIDLPEKVNDLRMLRAKTEKSFLFYSRNSLIRKGAPVIVMRIVRK